MDGYTAEILDDKITSDEHTLRVHVVESMGSKNCSHTKSVSFT